MIMNKKIFTLLAGAFLMFAMVFSVKAQGPMWDRSGLSLGDSVHILKEGMNPGYYHLRVDSIVNSASTGGFDRFPDSTFVLYMGQVNAQGNAILFIDSLNRARANWKVGTGEQFASNSKAEESAASLWCVNITKYAQGQNLIFDFINKQQKEMLEVDTYGYESWGKAIDGADKAQHVGPNSIPGGVSGWAFSSSSATMLYSRPLMSYITTDTVAVLCMDRDRNTTGRPVGHGFGKGDSVFVKIASANDVLNRRVEGVIYFRLMHAAPFIVNAVDYNTYFGTKPTSQAGRLTFNKDVTSNYTNPFSKSDLTAQHLDADLDGGKRIVPNWDPSDGTAANMPGVNGNYYDSTYYSAQYLDSLGYMKFRTSTGNYVQVLREFFDGNVGGHEFLKIDTQPWSSTNDVVDSMFYGQKVFRMVYYPSGDSIYINPYQATYVPFWNQIQDDYKAHNFTDSATLAIFTYFADATVLQNDSVTPGGVWDTQYGDTLRQITARLKYGNRDFFYQPFLAHHKLYVSLQDLTGENRRLTVHTSAARNNTINTQINFGLYTPCSDVGPTDKTTVGSDVYLIRNVAGQYLQVPLYSASDSALWVSLEQDEDPRYIPSFHWVVEKRYTGSTISPVKITNREFEWLKFDNIQLYTDVRPITLRNKTYTWNTKDINAKETTTWANRGNNSFAFIKLEKEFKNDPYLGYEYIDPDTSVVNLFAFNYMSGINSTKYIGWKGDLDAYPKTDTTLYVNFESYFDKMYFSLDTIQEDGYGDVAEYGFNAKGTTQISDLVTLKRQAYRLTYKNPFKYNCKHEFCMAPGEDGYFGISKKGYFKDILGKPVFYLRHHYKVADDVPYFSLVQRIDSTTTSPANTNDTIAFRAYLVKTVGEQATKVIMGQLRLAGKVNPALFVANYEASTAKMKMLIRADAQKGGITIFKLEKDVDPLYRRFNTINEGETNDNPDLVHFYHVYNTGQLLFENTGHIKEQQDYWKDGKKNYLGVVLDTENPNLESHSSTTIYVDTAYVNRGTGYIKPQYLLAVRPVIVEDTMGCDIYGEPTIPMKGYVQAHYLINAHDSAYATATANQDYLWQRTWTRLVFTRAIHANDYLYILGDAVMPDEVYGKLKDGGKIFDLDKLHTYALRTDNNIHAIYLGNNLHKDCVFSFRFVERGSLNFIIESETTNRDTINGPMIAPCEGGWVKYQNGVPVITASDEVDGMEQAMLTDVRKATEGEKPTGNDKLDTNAVTVVGNAGGVTILNAAGKSVVINNILGQTVAKAVLTSDNETIPASKGVVIVSIDGEEAVKTLVK